MWDTSVTYAEWAGKMTRTLGERVKTHLGKIFNKIHGPVPEKQDQVFGSMRREEGAHEFVGQPFKAIADRLSILPSPKGVIRDRTPAQIFARAGQWLFPHYSKIITAGDGVRVRISNPNEPGKWAFLRHLTRERKTNQFHDNKARWVPVIEETLKNPQVRLRDINGDRIYVSRYEDTNHVVIVSPEGNLKNFGTGSFADLMSHFPRTERTGMGERRISLGGATAERPGDRDELPVEWAGRSARADDHHPGDQTASGPLSKVTTDSRQNDTTAPPPPRELNKDSGPPQSRYENNTAQEISSVNSRPHDRYEWAKGLNHVLTQMAGDQDATATQRARMSLT
ncbi:MAG: hypothetical protein DLM52_13375 [Chthoniobacterales bacterium]|nr:MAG: hypothetical protein DLM52_13375 [Chthoniobacterales bacterium]